MDEEKNEDQPEEQTSLSLWIKDNLRIIISIAIVIAIAGGIYSYSKRTQPEVGEEKMMSEETQEEGQIAKVESDQQAETQKSEETKKPEDKTTEKPTQTQTPAPGGSSQETSGSFIETAGRGDGVTHLARRALANYLEKNPDSALKPEHKIYIEDYLRKHVGFSGRVHVGTTVEFSKDLIKEAIDQSKKLNENQIRNLHKYVVRVPSLT